MAEHAPETSLVLASGSPRRRELLTGLGLRFTVQAADIDETPHPDEDPVEYVARLAREKALAVAAVVGRSGDERVAVLAADTTVALGSEILAKPADEDDARRMLRSLSGRAHTVHTGVALDVRGGGSTTRSEVTVVTTAVVMATLHEDDIAWYVATGEPMDKAGAYAIQGRAATFVRRVEGSVSNVVGLPMAETVALLARVGIQLAALRG